MYYSAAGKNVANVDINVYVRCKEWIVYYTKLQNKEDVLASMVRSNRMWHFCLFQDELLMKSFE